MDQIINFLVIRGLISKPQEINLVGRGLMEIFLFLVIIALVIEEFIYRWLPIRGICLITKNRLALWTIIITSSVVFGILHGSWHHIFMQGMIGIIFSLAFLKGGYLSSATAHATYNFLIFAILFFSKQI